MMSSCSDFLDQTSPSDLPVEDVFNSLDYANNVLNKAYGELTVDQSYGQYFGIIWNTNSDYELIDGLGATAEDTSSDRGNMNYNQNPGWANLARAWDKMYSIIEYTNQIITGLNNGKLLTDESTSVRTEALKIKAEAQTIRAMVYLDLIRNFGDIPMKTEPSKTDLSDAYLGKADRDEILDFLITDLEEAITNLPYAGAVTTEHITRGYAQALLANIALTRAGWAIREKSKTGYETATISDAQYPTQRPAQEERTALYNKALTHLSDLITSNIHQLNPSISNYWLLVNQLQLDVTYKENLFEIPMGLGISGELGYSIGVRISGSSTQYGTKGNSSGKIKVVAPYFWSFNKYDLRRDLTCAPYNLKDSEGIIIEEFDGNKPFEIYVAKWDIRKMTEEWRAMAIATGNAKWFTGINVTKIRYSYVLLMYAEVMNELYGGPDVNGPAGLTARQALEKVHTRAFSAENQAVAKSYIENLPADKESFFNAIVEENAWELAGEGYRKYDLIRWNLLGERIQKMKDDYIAQISEYPIKLYFKYKEDNSTIDMTSVQWYATAEEQADLASAPASEGWISKTFWGDESRTQNKTNLNDKLPSISAGLNTTVINRYVMPIASTTISASNGTLSNSYGFSN